MSVVVAVKKNGRVVIAADSLVSCSGSLVFPQSASRMEARFAGSERACSRSSALRRTTNVIESIAIRFKKLLRLKKRG